MRKNYKPAYDNLKKQFIEEGLGILDLTSDIEDTIALCDVYIGDSGTSVTSLFGVAGKPVFILNNNIHILPEKDDWRGSGLPALILIFGEKPDIRLQRIINCGFLKRMISAINFIWILETVILAVIIMRAQ